MGNLFVFEVGFVIKCYCVDVCDIIFVFVVDEDDVGRDWFVVIDFYDIVDFDLILFDWDLIYVIVFFFGFWLWFSI